jgi:DNA invertase Pin-like site-specific DNA recombinase
MGKYNKPCTEEQAKRLKELDAAGTSHAARAALHAYVVELRDAEVTNQAIADVLGCTRQFVSKMEGKGRKDKEEAA